MDMQVHLQNETDRLREERLRIEEERRKMEEQIEQHRQMEEARKKEQEEAEKLRAEEAERRKQELERLRLEEERRKEEAEATAMTLQAELETLVSTSEFVTSGVAEKSKSLDELKDDDDIIRTCEEIDTEIKDAKASIKMCLEFIALKHMSLIGASEETKLKAQKYRTRTQDANRSIDRDAAKASTRKKKAIASKEAEAKRVAAVKAAEKQEQLFKQYDTDSDGKLNAVEIMEFVKGEYDFEFPLERAEAVLKQDAFSGLGGVNFAKFPHLKMLIGIARNEALAKKRKKEQEEKEKADKEEAERKKKLAAEQTVQLLAGVKIVESAMSGIEAEVAKAEEKAKPLAFTRGRAMIPLDMVEDRADEVFVAVDAARDFLAAAKDQASSMAGVPNDKLEPSVIPNCPPARQLFFRLEYMEKRLALTAKAAQSAKDRAILAQKKAQLMREASEAAMQATMMARQQQLQQQQQQQAAAASVLPPAVPTVVPAVLPPLPGLPGLEGMVVPPSLPPLQQPAPSPDIPPPAPPSEPIEKPVVAASVEPPIPEGAS